MSADTNLGTSTDTAKASDDDEADYRKIPYMLITSSKVTMEQAMDLAKLESKRPTKQDAVHNYDYMKYVKEQVLVWARDKIRQWQFEEARKQGMEISDWGGIQQNFAEDGSMKMMETMYEIMNGTFEKYDLMNELTWSKKLEKDALKHFLLKYTDQP